MSDVFTIREINEVADAPAGAVTSAIALDQKAERDASYTEKAAKSQPAAPARMSYASVGGAGEVTFESPKAESKQV